jgi:hypothetical protein
MITAHPEKVGPRRAHPRFTAFMGPPDKPGDDEQKEGA